MAGSIEDRRSAEASGPARIGARFPASPRTAETQAMSRIKTPEAVDHHRRRFFGTAAMTLAAAQLGMIGSAAAQSGKTNRQTARDQAGDEHVVRLAEADRCRPPECRLCRSRSGRWSRCHSSARLALRHSQLCRCRAFAGVGGLPGDRPVSARLWHDALSFQRDVPEWPAVGGRSRYHRFDGCSQDREGDHRPVLIGERGRPTSSRRSGRSAARPWSP